jgi:tetratricopeptide (TPR) repeat protein
MTDAQPNEREERDDSAEDEGRDEREGRNGFDGIDRGDRAGFGDRGFGGGGFGDRAGFDEREGAYELFRRGAELLARRHHAQAAVVLERAARLEPGKGSILEALGRAYYNSAQWEPAGVTFEALLDLDPSAHYAQYGLGMSLKQHGRIEESRTHLRLAVALSPESALYREALGRLPVSPVERSPD